MAARWRATSSRSSVRELSSMDRSPSVMGLMTRRSTAHKLAPSGTSVMGDTGFALRLEELLEVGEDRGAGVVGRIGAGDGVDLRRGFIGGEAVSVRELARRVGCRRACVRPAPADAAAECALVEVRVAAVDARLDAGDLLDREIG